MLLLTRFNNYSEIKYVQLTQLSFKNKYFTFSGLTRLVPLSKDRVKLQIINVISNVSHEQ